MIFFLIDTISRSLNGRDKLGLRQLFHVGNGRGALASAKRFGGAWVAPLLPTLELPVPKK